MTKGEARELYLRYLGERTVNGSPIGDQDLSDVFDGLLGPAILFVGSTFPVKDEIEVKKEDYVESEGWYIKDVPVDLAHIIDVKDKHSLLPVSYQRHGNVPGGHIFVQRAPSIIEYAKRPTFLGPDAADTDVIDLDPRYAQVVPLKAAVDAATGLEEYYYKATSLAQALNTMIMAMQDADVPSRRRVL